MKARVYFVSDHTGLTVESLGRTLLSQFRLEACDYVTKPYIDTHEKAKSLADEIMANEEQETRTIVFSSFVDQALRQAFTQNGLEHFDLFSEFLPRLEKTLEQKAAGESGLAHGVGDYTKYMRRIEAIDYTLSHDDGLKTKGYEKADIILVGVSRSGKTPTSLYLAIQFGLCAANYPLTEDDFSMPTLPTSLEAYQSKLFGLLISPQRLHEIRSERLPNSRYASLKQCQHELKQIETMYQRAGVPFIDTTSLSIEEISTQILSQTGVKKNFN